MVRESAEGVIETIVRREDRLAHERGGADELIADGGQKHLEVDHAKDRALVVHDRSTRNPSRLNPGPRGSHGFVGPYDQPRLPSCPAHRDRREQRKCETEPL